MRPESILAILGELALLKMFPAEDGPRLALAKVVCSMASTEDQVQWLVDRTLQLCNEFPGPGVLRQIFCSGFRPADGVEVTRSEMFPAGVPSLSKLEFPSLPALPPGAAVSALPGLDRAILRLARSKDIGRIVRHPADMSARAIESGAVAEFKPITQADIDRAVQELRDKRARDESGL